MGLKTGGILLGRTFGWNVEGVLDYLGVPYAPENDARRRATLARSRTASPMPRS
jgi:hypothetical protein